MNCKNRFTALLLTVCMMLSMFTITVSAAAPSKMTVSGIASASSDVASTIQTAIESGTADNNGVYSNVVVPSAIVVGNYSMGIEDYTLMAARAIRLISKGSAATTEVPYVDVTLTKATAAGAEASTVTSGMILDLAERVELYGLAESKLPTSFNRPADGTSTYDGRLCIYSIAHIFAKALASYASTGKLPTSVSFTPSSYTTSTTSAPQEPTVNTNDMYYQVIEAAKVLKKYVEDKETITTTVTVGTTSYGLAEYEYLAAQAIVNINSGITSGDLDVLDLTEATNPSETVSKGTLALTEYIDMATRTVNWCKNNGCAANYTTCSLGQMHYYERVYFFSSILAYYGENGTLPATATVNTWSALCGFTAGNATFGADFSAYASYLVPTNNCQSTNATIISVAKTGMAYSSGAQGGFATPTNTYQAMFNLCEYLNDMTNYEYYSNTSRGALGTWNAKKGNCCDMAHLMNACARSLGVPGRYRHGNCTFSSMTTGHVWSDVFCGTAYASKDRYNSDGWLTADMVNNANYLGYKSNTTNYFYSDDKCAQLPF